MNTDAQEGRNPPFTIELTKNRRVVFDLSEDHKLYRVAWYERRRRPCPSCEGRGLGPGGLGLCKECHGRRFLWAMERTIGKSPELIDAIAAARGEFVDESGDRVISPTLDTVLLADYVFSTPWGSKLPRAKPWPPMDEHILASEKEAKAYFKEKFDEEFQRNG